MMTDVNGNAKTCGGKALGTSKFGVSQGGAHEDPSHYQHFHVPLTLAQALPHPLKSNKKEVPMVELLAAAVPTPAPGAPSIPDMD